MKKNPKQTLGTIGGAGIGALIGSQVGGGKGQLAAVAIGTLAGAWAGSEVGNSPFSSLDKADKLYAQRTAQNSLEYNKTSQSSSWRNPDSGHSGTFTPTRTYHTAGGANCREFETTIRGRTRREAASEACRQPDGSVENHPVSSNPTRRSWCERYHVSCTG